MTKTPISRFASTDPEDVAWRVNQAWVDAAIEGIERDPTLAAYVDELDAEGISTEEKIKRIIAFDLKAAKEHEKDKNGEMDN